MNLKEALDKLTEIIRLIQYADKTSDHLVILLQKFMIDVGQALVQRDEAQENLQSVLSHLWISHIKGSVDCPTCKSDVPIDLFVGTKGISGRTMVYETKDELIQNLEFPPITAKDLESCPIPDFMPDL